MRAISSQSCATSLVMAALSEADRVPLLYWTARSRTRCSIDCTSLIDPSAVWTSETASCAFRWAWSSPPTCDCSFWLIARPAASSAALLIRYPELRRSIESERCFEVLTRLRCAFIAAMFVWTLRDMLFLLEERVVRPRLASCGPARRLAFRSGLPPQAIHRQGLAGLLGAPCGLRANVDVREAVVLGVVRVVSLLRFLLRLFFGPFPLTALVAADARQRGGAGRWIDPERREPLEAIRHSASPRGTPLRWRARSI